MSTTEEKTSEEEAVDEGKKAWEERRERMRVEQNLPPGATPEERDLAYLHGSPDSAVLGKLQEAGDQRGLAEPAHGYEEHKKAASDNQKRKAAKESKGNARYFAGQKGWVNNPGEPDHGRAIGVLRVSEFQSEMDEVLDNVQGGRGKAKTYECETRDGRAEKLMVSAEHFRPCFNEAEWGKTPIMTPIPDES